MLIHITGLSGSGKSTLLKRLKKRLGNKAKFVDTDDIDDKHMLSLLREPKMRKCVDKGDILPVFKRRIQLNQEYLERVIESTDKPIIVVGLSFDGAADPGNYATYKYCIKVDPELVHQRAQMRTIEDICKHQRDLRALYESGATINMIQFLSIHKLGIRQPVIFVPPDIINGMKDDYKYYKKQGYKLASADTIFKEIVNLIKGG